MTACTIDHAIEGTVPTFLCRACNPEVYALYKEPPSFATVPASSLPAGSFRERHPLTKRDEAVIAELSVPITNKPGPLEPSDLTNKIVLGKGKGKPGIIATIVELMRRSKGATQAEMLAVLVERFPDRNPKGMSGTVAIQSKKLYSSKTEDKRRGGMVYRIKIVDED